MAINTSLLIKIAAENSTKAAFGEMNKSLDDLRKQVLGVVSALAGGLAFKDIIDSTRRWGTEVDRLRDELGGTAEDMSKLNFIGQSVGLTTDDLSTTFGILNKHIADSLEEITKGTSVFDKWGIKLKDANGHVVGFDEAMRRIKARFQEIGQGAQGTALLLDLFGRSGKSLSDFLALSDDQMRKMIADAQKFGLVLSEDGLAALDGFNREMYRFNLAITGLKLQIGQFLLPLMSAVITKITEWLGKAKQLGEAMNRMLGPLKEFIDKHGGVKAIADALLSIGVALLALAGVGALLALIGLISGLIAAAIPLALVAGGLLLVAGGLISIANALDSTEDPAKKIGDLIGGVATVFTGLSLILLPFAPIAALVAATLGLVAFALEAVWDNLVLLKENWDKMEEVLRHGDLQRIIAALPLPLRLVAEAWMAIARAIQIVIDLWNAAKALLGQSTPTVPPTPGSSGDSGFGPGGGAGNGVGGGGGGSYAQGTNYVPQTGWAMLHQGEAVIPARLNGAGNTIVINVGSVDSRSRVDDISDAVMRALNSQRKVMI